MKSSNNVKSFKEFNENLNISDVIIDTLELMGSIGLLVGMLYNPILIISSGGLALLMFIAILFRLKSKDTLWVSLPAIFYMLLNFYIFIESIK